MNRNMFVTGLMVFSFTSLTAFAAEVGPKVVLEGNIDTYFGSVNQKKAFDSTDPSNASTQKLQKTGITNDTNIDVIVEGKLQNGFKYGAEISLNADTSLDADDGVADHVFAYVESANFGKFEFGGGSAATKTMQVAGHSIAAKPGGTFGYMPKWIGKFNSDKGSDNQPTKFGDKFVKWAELINNCTGNSATNKITYYTPTFSGFRFGVSYTPDTDVTGTVSKLRSTAKQKDSDFTNLFNYAVSYEAKFGDLKWTTAAGAQTGKAKSKTMARHNAHSWEAGTKFEYGNFALAGSYGDWGKSGTPKVREAGRKYGADYWTLGTSYAFDKNFKASLTYFQGRRANVWADNEMPAGDRDTGYNKNQYVALGAEYKLAPGFMPFAEVSYFKAKRSTGGLSNSGYITLLGAGLQF